MKIKIIFIMLFACSFMSAVGQHFSEKISKELSFEKPGNNTLMIFNISGDLTIVGTTGDKVIIEIEKSITAKTDRRLEIGKTQLQLGVIDRADTILLYVEGLCNQFGRNKSARKDGRSNYNDNGRTGNWGYQWSSHDNCNEEFDHEMNFTIKVPAGINLYASTINNGDIKVENVMGVVRANNVNGNIALKNIAGPTNASTINGSVDLEYAANPPQECRYYSLNGDINAWFRKGLTANLTFESFNGGLYTNVNDVESMPVALIKKPTEHGIKYKIVGNQYKIGKGGVLLDFETFNGDVFLREKVN